MEHESADLTTIGTRPKASCKRSSVIQTISAPSANGWLQLVLGRTRDNKKSLGQRHALSLSLLRCFESAKQLCKVCQGDFRPVGLALYGCSNRKSGVTPEAEYSGIDAPTRGVVNI
eukprot:6212774-Pleurochrysis_carterae.AAC.1